MSMGRAGVLALAISCSVPLAAQPYSDVVSQSHYVEVRDGTRLAMSIYRPATGTAAVENRLPVVFAFTPYRARFRDENGRITEAALGDNLGMRSLIRAGYVVVNVNPLYTPRELQHQLNDSGAEAVVVLENFATTVQQVVASTSVKHVIVASMGPASTRAVRNSPRRMDGEMNADAPMTATTAPTATAETIAMRRKSRRRCTLMSIGRSMIVGLHCNLGASLRR